MKAIIFDFDGVILNSVNVKTEAFKELYKQYGLDVVKKVEKYHLENGGISRFKKFKYFHKNFLNIDLNNVEINQMANDFSNLVFEKVCNSNFISGAKEFLEYSKNKYLNFICTGTPEYEIKKILVEKKLTEYFNSVYGSPKTKVKIIKSIMTERKLNSNEILFIGDAMTDYNASLETNLNFIGIRNKETVFPEDVIQVDNLMEIIRIKNL